MTSLDDAMQVPEDNMAKESEEMVTSETGSPKLVRCRPNRVLVDTSSTPLVACSFVDGLVRYAYGVAGGSSDKYSLHIGFILKCKSSPDSENSVLLKRNKHGRLQEKFFLEDISSDAGFFVREHAVSFPFYNVDCEAGDTVRIHYIQWFSRDSYYSDSELANDPTIEKKYFGPLLKNLWEHPLNIVGLEIMDRNHSLIGAHVVGKEYEFRKYDDFKQQFEEPPEEFSEEKFNELLDNIRKASANFWESLDREAEEERLDNSQNDNNTEESLKGGSEE